MWTVFLLLSALRLLCYLWLPLSCSLCLSVFLEARESPPSCLWLPCCCPSPLGALVSPSIHPLPPRCCPQLHHLRLSMPPPAQPPARPPVAAVLSPGPAPSPPEVSASAHPVWPLDLLCLGRRRFPRSRSLNCSVAATFHVVGHLNYVACGSPLECIVSACSLSTDLLNSVWF